MKFIDYSIKNTIVVRFMVILLVIGGLFSYMKLGKLEDPEFKIKEALVVINAKSKNDKCICAYIVTDKKLSAKELREFLSGDLPDYMIPSDFVSIDKIPLNSSGKVDRKNLPSPVTNLEEKEIKNIKKPRNDIEAKIASAMCKVLGIDSMDIETNFFYAGGNSIKAIQLVSELEEEFSITVNDIFKSVVHTADHIVVQILVDKILPVDDRVECIQLFLGIQFIAAVPERPERLPDTRIIGLAGLPDIHAHAGKGLGCLACIKSRVVRPLICCHLIDQIFRLIKA